MFTGKIFSIYAKYFSLFLASTLFILLTSCEEKMEKPGDSVAFAEKLTCEGCHTDEETLRELAPGIDQPPPSSGGG